MAIWGLPELLLRSIDLRLAGANWQRGGGRGQKPKPVDLPSQDTRKPMSFAAGPEQRLRNLAQMRAEEAAGPDTPAADPAAPSDAAAVRPQDLLTFSE